MARLLRLIAAAAALASTSAMATERCVKLSQNDIQRQGCEAMIQLAPPAYDYETYCRQTFANHANPCLLDAQLGEEMARRAWHTLTPQERTEIIDTIERSFNDMSEAGRAKTGFTRAVWLASQVRSKVMQHFYNDAGK